MQTLYKLTEDYIKLLELAEDPEVDPEILADTMESLDYEIEEKADNYAKIIRQLSADSEALKTEIGRLKSRKEVIDNNIDRMKRNLEKSMIATDKKKFKTDLFSFNIQKNPPSLVVDEPYIENIPDKYLIEQEPTIDREKLKEDLKKGIKLDGVAHLEQGESLRIR